MKWWLKSVPVSEPVGAKYHSSVASTFCDWMGLSAGLPALPTDSVVLPLDGYRRRPGFRSAKLGRWMALPAIRRAISVGSSVAFNARLGSVSVLLVTVLKGVVEATPLTLL